MSEPKPISPLLDGFILGDPISDHDGICCRPAIKENTDQKYIVKIISIPASQKQMDALLLAGAYKDPADAMAYFEQLGTDAMQEASLLKALSSQDGFVSYTNWQMEPIPKGRLGYQVYLLGSYKRSLDKYVRGNPVTHLEAMNLSLDLCTALSICRQAGALYVDLKPSNIFITDNKEFCIGDLGFVSLDALGYTVIPDKYRSVYTPPELLDPMVALNMTVDTYAVGMILYQLYNEGQLPFRDTPPEEGVPSPANADYELAEIIMKAIDPDPAKRWTDPKEMGQAIVTYMQRNAINNVPITPHTPLYPQEEEAAPEAQPEGDLPSEPVAEDPLSAQAPAPTGSDDSQPEDLEDALSDQPAEEDETAPGEGDADLLLPHEMSDEMSKIVEKADDLISHQTPQGVVLPDVPDPPDPFAFAKDDPENVDDSDVPYDSVMRPEEPEDPQGKPSRRFRSQAGKKRAKKALATLTTLAVLGAAAYGGYWYYRNIYRLDIRSITVSGDKSQIVVAVDTDAGDDKLRVLCLNPAGEAQTSDVSNGLATFSGLEPATTYTLQLEPEGFHTLVGQTSVTFVTDTTTSILSFTAAMGPDEGTAVLTLTADGQLPETWVLNYGAEGEEPRRTTFSGNTVSVSNLTLGKNYTFVLDAGAELSLSGATSLEYIPSRLILAEDIAFSSNNGTDLTVAWKTPGGLQVESWDVRCYDDYGFETSQTVTENQATFDGLNFANGYNLEITAQGMTTPAQVSVSPNPVFLSGIQASSQEAGGLVLSWQYTGNPPAAGWKVSYRIDGTAMPELTSQQEAQVLIPNAIAGAVYDFTVASADGASVFNGVYSYTCPAAEPFQNYGLTAQDITLSLLKTPERPNWRYEHVGDEAFTDTFAAGDPMSIVLHAPADFRRPGAEISVMYIIRDAFGSVLPDYTTTQSRYWNDLWRDGDVHYGELDVPKVPAVPGSYTLQLCIDGALVAEQTFQIQ